MSNKKKIAISGLTEYFRTSQRKKKIAISGSKGKCDPKALTWSISKD